MSAATEGLIRDFCAAWSRLDIDGLLQFFTSDAVYHNMPLEPVQGLAAIGETFGMFLGPAERAEFALLAIASSGTLVFTERVDRFTIGGREIALPVAGVFEVRDGKIAAWRDYFDMQTWVKQATPA